MSHHTLPLAVLVHVADDVADTYAAPADLADQAAGWIRGGLDDRDGITGVEVGSGAAIVAEAFRRAADEIDAEYTGRGVAPPAWGAAMLRRRADVLDEADRRIPHEYVADDGQAEEPDQYRTDDRDLPTYQHTDVAGDRLMAAVADIPAIGPGVYFRTDQYGSSIPVGELPAFIARLQTIADAARSAVAKENG